MPDVNVGTAWASLKLRSDEFKSALRQANAQMDSSAKQMEKDFGRVRESINAASRVMMGIGVGAVGLGVAFTKSAMAMEQNQVAFANMLKSGQAARKMLSDLERFAARTPFQFNDVVAAARKMTALSVVTKEQMIPALTSIGDAVSALAGGPELMQRIIEAMGTMHAKQRVTAEEMMRFTEAGIPAWEILAQSIGKSTAETMKLVTRGVIPADDAIKALLNGMSGKFGGMMAEQAKTAKGAWSNFQDNLESFSRKVGEEFLPKVTAALKAANEQMEKMSDAQKKWLGELAVNAGVLVGGTGLLYTMARQFEKIRDILKTPYGKGSVAAVMMLLLTKGAWDFANRGGEEDQTQRTTNELGIRVPTSDINAELAASTKEVGRLSPGGKIPLPPKWLKKVKTGGIPPPLLQLSEEDTIQIAAINATTTQQELAAEQMNLRRLVRIRDSRKGTVEELSTVKRDIAQSDRKIRDLNKQIAEEDKRHREEIRKRELDEYQAKWQGWQDRIALLRQRIEQATLTGEGDVGDLNSQILWIRQAMAQWAAKGAGSKNPEIEKAGKGYQADVIAQHTAALNRLDEQRHERRKFSDAILKFGKDMSGAARQVLNTAVWIANKAIEPSPDIKGITATKDIFGGREAYKQMPDAYAGYFRDFGHALWDATRDKYAINNYFRQALDIVQGQNFSNLWERMFGGPNDAEHPNVIRQLLGNPGGKAGPLYGLVGKYFDKSNTKFYNPKIADYAEKAAAIYGAYQDAQQGGAFGGALSMGAAGFGVGGPLGAGVGALAGFLIGDSAERKRDGQMARQVQQEQLRELRKINAALSPVSDYFRSLGLNLLPGRLSFGSEYAMATSRGVRG